LGGRGHEATPQPVDEPGLRPNATETLRLQQFKVGLCSKAAKTHRCLSILTGTLLKSCKNIALFSQSSRDIAQKLQTTTRFQQLSSGCSQELQQNKAFLINSNRGFAKQLQKDCVSQQVFLGLCLKATPTQCL
jgi:hypothetical protein